MEGTITAYSGTSMTVNVDTTAGSGTYAAWTIGLTGVVNTGVTSFSGGSTGLTPATATSGVVTLAGTLAVDNGGTGATTLTGILKGNGTSAFSAATPDVDYIAPSAPVTKTADFTVAVGETWLINNKSGSTCTVTLPAAATYPGRYLTFQNYQDQTLVSASSNVIPQGGGSAGTAILTNVSGNWATLVSNGTNWVIMQAASFNNLLY
jgi:hypothetical protein